jgi:predicted DNA-binding transcriptional regulator YafY
LEEIHLGQAFLAPIKEAMLQSVELRIDYLQYQREDIQTFHFQPYALKVYNHRWYLLGYLKEQKELRTIALDRIHTLDKLTTTFSLPAKFDAHKYFENVIGIYVDKNLPVEKVKIRAYGKRADYLRSTPLHSRQTEGRSKHKEFAEFTYRLCVTPDLISQLLAMGDEVEILEPKELKEEMKKRINNMFNFYK